MKNNGNEVKIGPVQLIAIGYDDEAKFDGKVLEELERLEKLKTIRLLDLLFVKKDENGLLIALDIQGEELGSIVGALLGFEFEGENKKPAKKRDYEETEADKTMLNSSHIELIGESLAPGMAAGIVLIEHVWAKPLKQMIRDNGGHPLAEGFITPEGLAKVALEIEAMSSAISELEVEEESKSNRSKNNQTDKDYIRARA